MDDTALSRNTTHASDLQLGRSVIVMKIRCSSIVLAVMLWTVSVCAVTLSAPSAAQPLASPWDDVPPVHSKAGVSCPAGPKLQSSFKARSYYTDESHSIVDPELRAGYVDDVKGYQKSAQQVVRLADQYRATGDPALPLCVADLLHGLADSNVLGGQMDGPQAYTVRAWMLNAYAVSWLKVRAGVHGDAGETAEILTWLRRLARDTAKYNDRINRRNNLRYWAGLAVMTSAIATDDDQLFNWAINSYRIGIKQIEPDGSLDAEMRRGSRALIYHNFAAAPLVLMAYLAEKNGIDLIGENDRALSRLVTLVVHGLDDPSWIAQRAGVPQQAFLQNSNKLAWLHLYSREFGGGTYLSLLRRFPRRDELYLGGNLP